MKKSIQHLTIASILISLSVVINVFFRMFIANQFFGIPLFALPLIIGSIVLGPKTGAAMGLITDVLSFFLGSQTTFLPLFSFSRIAWGFLPGFFYYGKRQIFLLFIGILITHLVATTINSFALYLYQAEGMFLTLPTRLIMIPFNVTGLTILTSIVLISIPDEIKQISSNTALVR